MRITKLLLVLMGALLPLLGSASIPAGTTVYLDVSQHWCCAPSYGVYLSSDGGYNYILKPVAGYGGLYYFVTTKDTQENIRFWKAKDVESADFSGWCGGHYTAITNEDNSKKWSSSKPYFILDDEAGSKWHWAAEPLAPQGEAALEDVQVSFSNMNCVDSMLSVDITVTFSGMPCSIVISSDLIKSASNSKRVVAPQSPYTLSIYMDAEPEGTAHVVRVGAYADTEGETQIGERINVPFTMPHFSCQETHELTPCIGEELTLEATAETEEYLWNTGETDASISVRAKDEATYIVEAYTSRLSVKNNLMANGDFEEEFTGNPTSFDSEYIYVGAFDPVDIFGDGGIAQGLSGIFAISSSSQRTAPSFAPVLPHGGDYFALFDADKKGKAWFTNTAMSPNLVLEKDSHYVFSYWAVNLNTEDQNKHPAVLRFQITYGGTTYDLGEPFQPTSDNEWCYNEVVYTAVTDANDVEISVTDLTNHYGVGNDFGLDDIMFQRTTSTRKRVAHTDIFHIVPRDCGDEPFEPDNCVENLVYRKWGDVLFVDNGSSEVAGQIASYQWYRNNAPVEGATAQSYYNPTDMSGTYYVKLGLKNGQTIYTCPYRFGEFAPSAEQNPGDKPAVKSQIRSYLIGNIYLQQTEYEDGTVVYDKYIQL